MNIAVVCERSGIVRRAFRARGHNAISCDLMAAEDGETQYHYQGDARLFLPTRDWDMLIAFPDCTYLCSSGLHWNTRRPERKQLTEDALEFVRWLMSYPVGKISLENPIGCISSRIRKPDQIIQPYQFGEDASKSTCLWLKNLDLLKPTQYIYPRIVNGKKRWGNQTDSGQNKLTPSKTRAMDRARTYSGIAQAMAEQWG